MLFSIIIPASNAEKTIQKTIESINIPAEECEILVVINGSGDCTESITDKLREERGNIRIIHSETGVSNARNAGLSEAIGSWVFFLDADDKWSCDYDALKEVISTSENADLILFEYYKNDTLVVNNYEEIKTSSNMSDPENVLAWAMRKPTLRMTAWAKGFKLDFLKKNGIAFNNSLWIAEDSEFMTRCLIDSSRVRLSTLPVYRYYTHYISTTRSADLRRDEGYLQSIRAVEKIFSSKEERIKDAFTSYVVAEFNLIAVHDIYNCELKLRRAEKREHIKRILSDEIISRELSKLKLAGIIKDPTQIPAWCFRHKMYFAGGVMCWLRSLYNIKSYYRKIGRKR